MRPCRTMLLAIGLASLSGAALAAESAAPQAPRAQFDQPPPRDGDLRSFEDRVARFIHDVYLAGDRRTDEELQRLYAPTVAYFGGRRLSRARVVADKRAYYRRWPQRRYDMLRETLKVTRRPGAARVYDIAFEYTFDVASPSRTSSGRGYALMTMDLDQDGGRITRETGTVLERW